jgi:hypothetical protein
MTGILPGNTILPIEEREDTSLTSLSLSVNRSVIVLASNDVNDQSLFLNGLTQNILILFRTTSIPRASDALSSRTAFL